MKNDYQCDFLIIHHLLTIYPVINAQANETIDNWMELSLVNKQDEPSLLSQIPLSYSELPKKHLIDFHDLV